MLKDMEWRRRTTLSTDKAKETIITNTKDISMVLLPPLKRKRQLKLQSIQMLSQFLKPRKKLHTAHSWNFMLLEKNGVIRPSSLWKKARCGEDAITANFDTGVWPESVC